jgi:glucokinase
VEQYLSGTALWKIYNERAGGEELSSGYGFFERFDAGDETARGVLNGFIEDLATVSVSMANVLAPEAILFGGGLMDTAGRWWDDFSNAYEAAGSSHVRNVRLLRCERGNDAALLGAAWLALSRTTGARRAEL